MDTTQTPQSSKSPSARPCPNCADIMTIPPCAACGWQPGLVPIAQTQTADGPVTTFAAEKRHRFMLAFGGLSCVFGVMFLIGGFASGGGGGSIVAGIIFGPLIFTAGILTLKNTHGGKAWWGLSAKEKGLAVPGLIAGGVIGMCILPILLLMVAMLKMSTDAWRG
jgi:hypothetical protein